MALIQTATPAPPVRVLVVDDEFRIRLALRACLEAEGYAVEEAEDGLEALEKIRRDPPHVIVIDLAMPRLNGLATLRQLQALPDIAQPQVILLTAYSSPQAASEAAACGVSAFLEKPLLPDALRRTVEQVLGGAQQPV